jgi:hypothetical protein
MCSGSFRPLGLPIYVARVPAAPFASRAFSVAVVIRCLLRPSNDLRRAIEVLNRYIDGGSRQDQTMDLRDIENS